MTIMNSKFVNYNKLNPVFLFSNEAKEITVFISNFNYISNLNDYSHVFKFLGQYQTVLFNSLNFSMNYAKNYVIYFRFVGIHYFDIYFQNFFLFKSNYNGNYFFYFFI